MIAQARRLPTSEVAAIKRKFAGQGVAADSEFFIVPIPGGLVYIHQWEEIPWSEDGGKTIARNIPIRERLKQILAGET